MYANILRGGCHEDGTILFNSTRQQYEREWAQTHYVPLEYEEKLIYCEGDGALEQVTREAVELSFLEVFKTCLDMILCNVF